MRLVLVEPAATGHHMALYARLVAGALASRGWRISMLTTESAAADPAFDLVRAAGGASLDVHFMREVAPPRRKNPFSLLLFQFASYRALAQGYQRLRRESGQPDAIFIVNCDYYDKCMALLGSPFGSTPFAAVMMSVGFHRAPMGIAPPRRLEALNRRLFERLLAQSSLSAALVIDEAFTEYIRALNGRPGYHKVQLLPDVGELNGAESRDVARERLGIAQDDFVILVYGQLSSRKGIAELLSALTSASLVAPVTALLAGRPDRAIQEMLKSACATDLMAQGRLKTQLKFHQPDDEYRVFRAADAVWLGYVSGFSGSSGVMLQAASLGLPVIASEQGLIGWRAHRHKIGLIVQPQDSASVVSAINQLASDQQGRADMARNALAFSAGHKADQFVSVISGVIERSVVGVRT